MLLGGLFTLALGEGVCTRVRTHPQSPLLLHTPRLMLRPGPAAAVEFRPSSAGTSS